jgi:hypothetical protein
VEVACWPPAGRQCRRERLERETESRRVFKLALTWSVALNFMVFRVWPRALSACSWAWDRR